MIIKKSFNEGIKTESDYEEVATWRKIRYSKSQLLRKLQAFFESYETKGGEKRRRYQFLRRVKV